METKTLKICRFGDPILQKKAGEIKNIDNRLVQLALLMKQTMVRAPGVGLAAPQVGEPLQLAVMDISIGENPDDAIVLINPSLIESEGAEIDDEGCLSFPGFTMQVKRSQKVLIRYLALDGKEVEREFEGFSARVAQHEIDHLLGKLIIDHVSTLKRNLVKQEIKKLKKSGEW